MMNRLFAVVALVCATTASLKAQGLVPEWYTQGDNYFQPVEQFTENNFTMVYTVGMNAVCRHHCMHQRNCMSISTSTLR